MLTYREAVFSNYGTILISRGPSYSSLSDRGAGTTSVWRDKGYWSKNFTGNRNEVDAPEVRNELQSFVQTQTKILKNRVSIKVSKISWSYHIVNKIV